MPARDGTGPEGRGPLTGRGFGPCEGDRPRFVGRRPRFGRGLGPCGRGLARGWRGRW